MSLELDLLEIRLLELWDLVDRFIVWEAPRGYGGVRKPLLLDRNRSRFARFRDKLLPIVIDDDGIAAAYPQDRRTPTDFRGEYACRAEGWRRLRREVTFAPDSVVMSSDVDEIPPRHVVGWLRDFEVPLPLRLRLPSLRYGFGWRDRQTFADVLAFSPDQCAAIDREPHLARQLPARILCARGGVHLTSFVPPLGLLAKFAMTTDWEPGILPFLRNEHDECASMMADGRWFERRLSRYDAGTDPDGLIPWAARANRARYARYWA